ncbi:hypothetical protein [Schaalia vaccimaxillae]|uniref:hypothetical protein n=1 Tax=Schaalia vaccimaxillae TaxID=183916 RepID=UPI00042019CE|nr:hypothetical protein [Schaalia vaccimaxillae]
MSFLQVLLGFQRTDASKKIREPQGPENSVDNGGSDPPSPEQRVQATRWWPQVEISRRGM